MSSRVAPEVRVADLEQEAFIIYASSEAAGLRATVMAACEAAGFVPHVAQEATQIPTVLALVESGLEVALVPEVMRGYREPRIAYKALQEVRLATETTLSLAWVGGNESPAAQRFIDLVRSLAPD